MTNSDLRHRAQTIQALLEQRDDITAEIKACYDSAASAGFNKPAMRKAIKVAAMSQDKRAKHDSEEMDIELYLAEIEGKGSSEINSAKTVTEATVAYLQESRRIRERSA